MQKLVAQPRALAPIPALARPALDRASRLAAMAILVASTLAGVMEQSAAEREEQATLAAEAAAHRAATLAPPTKELMVGAYAGAQYTYASDVVVKKPGVHDVTVKEVGWDGEPFDNPIYYGVRIVNWLEGGRTGAMLDFTHSKVLARMGDTAAFKGMLDGKPAPEKAKIGDVFRRLEATHGHNMLTLNGLLRLADINPRVSPYVGIGAGINLPHSEVQMKEDPTRTYEYQYTGPAAQAVIGLELRIPRMSYFIEYKFTFARYEMPLTGVDGSLLFIDLWRQFSRWWSGKAPPGGFLWTNLTSHQIIAGLGARFGAVPAAPTAP